MTDAPAPGQRIKPRPRIEGEAIGAKRAERSALRKSQRHERSAAKKGAAPSGASPGGVLPPGRVRKGAVQDSGVGDAKRELAAALALKKDKSAGRGRFKIMVEKVKEVLARHPDFTDACVAHLTLLRRLERFPKAAKFAEKYREQFPHDRQLILLHAGILDDLKDFAGALALLSTVRATEPPTAAVENLYIKALAQLDRLEDADAACASALAAFPGDTRLLRQYASMATRRGEWGEALRRWQEAAKLWPDSAPVKRGLEDARLHVADQQPAGAETQTGESGRFFGRFESLGGNLGGCEFGLVQRKFGSSSLSLLRWSNVPIEAITEGMQNGFQGLGEVENTELRTFKPTPDREEYRVWDVKYGLGAHTFIQTKEAPADKMLLQTAKRLTYLKGKLLEELGTAKKVFVYKIRTPADDATIRKIFAAVRQQGPATLMCVLKADADNPPGSVRKIDDGLYAGYVRYFMMEAPGGEAETIDFATWQTICTDVLARHDAAA